MAKNIPVKIKFKSKRHRVKIRYLTVALAFISVTLPAQFVAEQVHAADCPDVKLIFARGSGEKQDIGASFFALNAALGSKLQDTGLTYQSEDVLYPAPAVGLASAKDALVTLGAYVSGGESFEFGRSVSEGVNRLTSELNSDACPHTRYVLAGYSQGAMVVDKTLTRVNDPSKILYAATFGDPKIYLPEGQGVYPAACRGENLSDYRMHVPECHAYKGILGPYNPYRPDSMIGKVGTWCNNHDILCSSYVSFKDHEEYIANNLYEDASKVMFDKVNQYFSLNSRVASPHDTAILIDSSNSMRDMIAQYKAEALRLAQETLNSGGRVALYDYRDLDDPYEATQRCSFVTCTDLDVFQQKLDEITVDGGGDNPESLLSTALHAMNDMQWQYGATKSIVVLTDDGFLSPDRDGTSLEKVVELSKKIDPVNFYIITDSYAARQYEQLASRTDGKVFTDLNQLNLVTDYIMDRYDSLPRVEESSAPLTLPTLSIDSLERSADGTSAHVKYSTDAPKVIVSLNDTMLGITDQTEFTLTDLKPEYANTLTLTPLTDEVRGEAVSAVINEGLSFDDLLASPAVPKAPDTSAPTFSLFWNPARFSTSAFSSK